MSKILISFSDDGFPNKDLGSICFRNFIGAFGVLRYPAGADIPGIAVLQDSADQQLDGIRLNGVVVFRRVVVPIIFSFLFYRITILHRNPRFNAVTDRP